MYTNLTVKTLGILRLLVINTVAVHLLLSMTLACDELKCRLITSVIEDTMDL